MDSHITIKNARSSLVLFTVLTTASLCHGQVGSETEHWNWTPPAAHHAAIVKVETESGSGTGVLVHVYKTRPVANGHEGLCLTAYHVVSDSIEQGSIKVHYQNGKRGRHCKVVASNKALDVALLWVWVPHGVEAAELAVDEAEKDTALEFSGLGGGSSLSSLRHFSSVSESPTNANQIFASTPLLPGDSGGPVFNSTGQVIGIISGGWFWFDGGVKSQRGNNISLTWPARACNLDPLSELLEQAIAKQSALVSK